MRVVYAGISSSQDEKLRIDEALIKMADSTGNSSTDWRWLFDKNSRADNADGVNWAVRARLKQG